MIRQRFIIIVGLLVIGGITICNYLFPTSARLLPGYESLRVTDQGTCHLEWMFIKLVCLQSS